MSATPSRTRRLKTAMLKPLLSSLILSMSLTGCIFDGNTRVQFITPNLQSDELTCLDRPHGQLPATATNGQAADKITSIDEAGEDCRQKLGRARMKVEVFNEVVAEMNAATNPKKKD